MLTRLDLRRVGQGRALQPLVKAINGDETTAMLEGSLPNRLVENRLSSSIACCVDFETIRVSNFGRNQAPAHLDKSTLASLSVSPNDGLIGTGSYVVVGRELEAWRKLADFECLFDALLV
jgi:hypothetical protein